MFNVIYIDVQVVMLDSVQDKRVISYLSYATQLQNGAVYLPQMQYLSHLLPGPVLTPAPGVFWVSILLWRGRLLTTSEACLLESIGLVSGGEASVWSLTPETSQPASRETPGRGWFLGGDLVLEFLCFFSVFLQTGTCHLQRGDRS